MKIFIKTWYTVPVLLALAGQLTAQSFTNLYNFGEGSDGANPYAGLLLFSNKFYGTAYAGGDAGVGTVFSLNTDGTAFTNLYSFSGGSDGAKPHGALVVSGRTLYGTTSTGGTNNDGTVFAINVDGTGFNTLHTFTGNDGTTPAYALTLVGNMLYGTTQDGGDLGYGTVFALNSDGTGFTVLHSFSGTDGSSPESMVISGGTLYGAALAGGSGGNGTLFRINTDGTGFTNLYNFTATPSPPFVNPDGIGPNGLILSGQTLYGTAGGGGVSGNGTLFAINADGTGFKTLHSFTGGSDGRLPLSPLFLSGGTLYGAAQDTGGGSGTIFAINTHGTGFTNVYNFTAATSGVPLQNGDGVQPNGGLVSSGNILFGTARFGGNLGYGTIFSISLPSTANPPALRITLAAGNVMLSWPADATGFALQSTTNLGSPAIWSTNLPAPGLVNGQYTVTNPVLNTPQLFRLRK